MKKFRDLSKESKLELCEALLDGKEIVYHDGDEVMHSVTFNSGGGVHFYASNYYEVKVSKPSINWDSINPKWNYLAIDEDGDTYLYTEKPHTNSCEWENSEDSISWGIEDNEVLVFDKGHCDWKDSLISRFDDQPVEATVGER